MVYYPVVFYLKIIFFQIAVNDYKRIIGKYNGIFKGTLES